MQQIIDIPELSGLCSSRFPGYVSDRAEDDRNKLSHGTVIDDRDLGAAKSVAVQSAAVHLFGSVSPEQAVSGLPKSSDSLLGSSVASTRPVSLPHESEKSHIVSALARAAIFFVIVSAFVLFGWNGCRESSASAKSTSSTTSKEKKAPPTLNVNILREKAEAGDAIAQAEYGVLFLTGEEVQTNYAEAMKWFLKSSKQGYMRANGYLGLMYFKGIGVAKDHVQAAKYFRVAAVHGIPYAQYLLGMMYCAGDGVPQNTTVGYNWIRKAAAHGLEEAIEFLKQP